MQKMYKVITINSSVVRRVNYSSNVNEVFTNCSSVHEADAICSFFIHFCTQIVNKVCPIRENCGQNVAKLLLNCGFFVNSSVAERFCLQFGNNLFTVCSLVRQTNYLTRGCAHARRGNAPRKFPPSIYMTIRAMCADAVRLYK